MRTGRSRQKHDHANDVSCGRHGNYTRSDSNTAGRRLYRDSSPNADAGDTTCYARVDRASGRAIENVRADRPKRDQQRDKKHNINVHRRLRFDDSCSELDDDDDLYANNVDRGSNQRRDRDKLRSRKPVNETRASSGRRKQTDDKRRGRVARDGQGRRHRRLGSSDRDGRDRRTPPAPRRRGRPTSAFPGDDISDDAVVNIASHSRHRIKPRTF